MKLFKNKKAVSATAIILLLVLTISAISMSPSTALAARFPGVDYLIKDNTNANPMNILEIVSSKTEASFGFYIKGQEPFGVDENGNALTFEETLVSTITKEKREEYMTTLLTKLDGKYTNKNSGTEYPLIYETYEEKYFLDSTDDTSVWKKLTFAEIQTVKMNGYYQPVESEDGSVVYGDYLLKLASYEPAADGTGKFVENIAAFQYAGDGNNYNVTFTADTALAKPEYGAYRETYIEVARMGEEGAPVDGIFWVQNMDGTFSQVDLDVNQEAVLNGTILYLKEYALLEGELKEGEVPYYVESFEYSYSAEGRYSVIYASEEHFVPAENGTHVRVEDRYAYAPGQGNYHFIVDESAAEVDVEVDSFYYKGGFTNNNWFSKYVLTLTGTDLSDNRMSIRVQTKLSTEISAEDFVGKDLIVVSSDISSDMAASLESLIHSASLPCIINSQVVANTESNLYKSLQSYMKEDADNNYVSGSIYWHTGDVFVSDLPTVWKGDALLGFEEISDYISLENQFLKLEKKELLSTDVSRAVAIQYILGKQAARVVPQKTKLNVLEIQPCAQYVVTPTIVKGITGYSSMPDSDISIVRMTTAEFIGKIEDLNGTYDFIYIGMATGRMNTDDAGQTLYNDGSMNGLIYTHTGDAVIAEGRLAGLLDTDYVFNDRPEYQKLSSGGYRVISGTGNYPYDKEVYKIRTYVDGGILRVRPEDVLFKLNKAGDNSDANGTYEKVTVGNVGVYRYSGNDITAEKMEQLESYMQAGYPVILAEGFFGNTTRGSRTVNASKVDNSSYMYQFANEVINKDNCFRDADIVGRASTVEAEALDFYMNIPKLNINYVDGGSLPISVLPGDNGGVARYLEADSGGRYYLSYTFKIENEAAAKPAETKYKVSLYIDINSDGKYSRSTELMSDIVVHEAGDPTKLVDMNALEENVLYTVSRQIPDDFESVIPWKLEVSQVANECIRKAIVGYSAIPKSEATPISILQIIPASGNTWNFANDSEFQELLDDVDNVFDITITTKTVSQIDNLSDPFATLNGYDMLILGFKDMYGEFTNESTAKAILRYIDTGKSVLFTHDTTSFVNTQERKLDSKDKKGLFGLGSDNSTMSANNWGYYLNTEIRDALGMDRYGITSTEKVSDSSTIRDELRKGQILNPGLATTDPDYDANDKTVVNAIANAQKDIAYAANTNRKQTYPEVQGYTYAAINLAKKDLGTANHTGSVFNEISSSTSIDGNEIVIAADYDAGKEYVIEANMDINGQFDLYVGALSEVFGSEARTVDWTIAGRAKTAGFHVTAGAGRVFLKRTAGSIPSGISFKVYEISSGGTSGTTSAHLNLNSKSGVHSMGSSNSFSNTTVTAVNHGQITNYPYKIDDSFTVANTHAQYYQLDLEADRDNDGESDIVVWYCISDGGNNDLSDNPTGANYLESDDLYSASPNDVRNNYYIYSIGNVFYTGVGHSNVVSGNSINEKKLFINTMVAAYASSTVKPEVTALSSENVLAAAATSIAVPTELLTDNVGQKTEHEIEYFYSVFDANLVSGSLISGNDKVLTARYYIESADGTEKINGTNVIDITNQVTTTTNKNAVSKTTDGSYIVASGQAYTCKWKTTELTNLLNVKDNFNLIIKVTSSFTHNGEVKHLDGTDQIHIKQVNLFDLD